VTRQRGGATRRRDDYDEEPNSTAENIGRQLRGAREERGLDLLAVHDRLSRPITQLEAIERGDLASLPDQAQALSTLRRYAAFVGLDGDALALRMIDAWSNGTPSTNGAAHAAALTNVVAAVTTGPDHLRAFTQTGQVPKVGAGSTAAASGYGFGLATGPPTGTFPVVPKQELRQSKRAVARARRRLRASKPLRVTTWVAGLLLLAALAGSVIAQVQPQWLASAHILRVVEPGGAQPSAPAPAPSTTVPHAHTPVVVPGLSDGQSAAFTVHAAAFTVEITTTGRCWVQVTSSASPTPLVSGVQDAGQKLSYPAQGTMTVQVGSSAVVVAVAVKGKVQFYNAPQTVPFTYMFAPG
jgi:cytoskeleton protein RodZ